jgi:hypothetical protein
VPAPVASLVELLDGAVGLTAVFSGLAAGGVRSLAVLWRASEKTTDRLTAVGFVAGMAIALMVLGIDLLMR